jgi:DNA-binding Lrp family transcriptional regulator
MVFSRREKEERVKQLYEEGKTVREIAKEVHMSFSDIGAIIKKVTGDNSVTKPPVSTETRALQLFSSGKRPIDVTIELDISPEEAEKFFIHYWRLKQQYDFEVQYKDIKNRLPSFLKVYGVIVREGVTEKEAVNFVRCANEIPQLRNVYESLKKEIVGLENKKGGSLVEIDSLQIEIDYLQKVMNTI